MPRTAPVWAVLWSATLVATAVAAEPDSPEQRIRLAITPAVEPLPSLKHQLLPPFIRRRTGNAALDYGRAMLVYKPDPATDEHVMQWLELPPAEFDAVAREKKLAEHDESAVVDLLRLAARCENCDWQPPLREQNPFYVMLPETNQMRALARLTALQARVRLAEGKYDETLELVQVGYSMARHIAAEPTLINGLVGLSIATMFDRVLLDFAQRPGSPSLYWAVSFLPRPLVDRRPGLEAEMYSLDLMFPIFQTDAERSPEQWQQAVNQFLAELPKMAALSVDEPRDAEWEKMFGVMIALGKTALRREELKKYVADCGEDAALVAQMSDPQLLLVFTRYKYQELRDRMFRSMLLPYAEGRPLLDEGERRFKRAVQDGEEILPFAAILLPAVSRVNDSYARADRRHDVLRIVEALRLYAGKHDGALPPTLADVTDVPLPTLDVVTGKPFLYTLDGDTARLTLPDEKRAEQGTLVYEISVAR